MRLQLEQVSKSYGTFRALDAVSIDVPPGSIVALLGANGAGKTTLLRCLATLLLPDTGRVLCDGEALGRDRLDLRRRFAFLPDLPPLYPHMSVLRHLGMVLRLYGAPLDGIEDRVIGILRDLDLLLFAEVPVSRLSRGQAYKAALTAVLAADPEVWMIDEPFASGMDPQGISTFKARARAHCNLGGTVLYSTQILDIAEGFSDLVCILDRGEVRAFGPIKSLEAPSTPGSGVLEAIFRRLREERS